MTTETTKIENLTEEQLQASLDRAVCVESRQNGKLVNAPGMSEEEQAIRLYDANWNEEDARRTQDKLVACGATTRAAADDHLAFLIKKAEWSSRVVKRLDAERASAEAAPGTT